MIYVEMTGRLGNQLFRYAIAKKIQILNHKKEKLRFNFDNVYQSGSTEEGFEDALKYFNTDSYECVHGSIIRTASPLQKILYYSLVILTRLGVGKLLYKKFAAYAGGKGVYFVGKGTPYFNIRKSNTVNKYIIGRFEDPNYFDDILHILRNTIIPKKPLLDKNREIYTEILKTESVCITVRRGDYISNKQFSKCFNICDMNYWERAIKRLIKEIPDATFFVFSDDIEWCKKNFNLFNNEKVFYESGNDPIWEKLRLMYSCKHFIISNSTFSWWAQYLSRNDKKLVISPNRWFSDEVTGCYTYPLIMDHFIKINID